MFLFRKKEPTKKESNSKSFGTNLSVDGKSVSAEISSVGDHVIKTNKKYLTEINKYKKIADFNKKLSDSYSANMYAMIDVSKLLNDYVQFFNILKEEMSKMDHLGILKAEDVAYLESLTKSKMEEFTNSFMKESDKVRILYEKFGQDTEMRHINKARDSMKNVMGNATVTYKELLEDINKSNTNSNSNNYNARKSNSNANSNARNTKINVRNNRAKINANSKNTNVNTNVNSFKNSNTLKKNSVNIKNYLNSK